MNALELLAEALKEKGYGGLYDGTGCGCWIDDLIPCGEDPSNCEPGYDIPCDGSCKEGEYFDWVEDDCNGRHIVAEKPVSNKAARPGDAT